MSLDQWVSLFSALLSLVGLLFVAWQLRNGIRQRQLESMVRLFDNNRQLITLGFSRPELFPILDDSPTADPILERHYLQLWLNQFWLLHAYVEHSMFGNDFKESMERDMTDFLRMANMRRHWRRFGTFYPASFKNYINQIIRNTEPPVAAQVDSPQSGI